MPRPARLEWVLRYAAFPAWQRLRLTRCVAPWSPIQTLIRTVFAVPRTPLFLEMKIQKRTSAQKMLRPN